MQKRLTYLYGVCACLVLMFLGFLFSMGDGQGGLELGSFLPKREPPVSLLFTGDIMLARHVETAATERGLPTLFSGVTDFLTEHDYVIGNFEASVPKTHHRTEGGSLRFSVREDLAKELASFGFTHLSLANNHGFDYGEEGYRHAEEVITEGGMVPMGDPRKVTDDDVVYITYGRDGKYTLATIPVHATTQVDQGAIVKVLENAALHSELQIIYVHWGEEYVPEASPEQQKLAHALVDAGADLIVGHHPHVIEGVEEYEGAYILYSLGNFVFDQYWNEEVKTGLLLGLRIEGDEVSYTLYPVKSEKSVPGLLSGEEYDATLSLLAARSEPDLRASIEKGVLEQNETRLALERGR